MSRVAFEHGGNRRLLARVSGKSPDEVLDFSASINPLGPPDCLRPFISRSLERIIHYPDPHCTDLVKAIASTHLVDPGQVVVGNGSTELIHAIPRAFDLRKVVIPAPAYAGYARAAECAGVPVEYRLPEETEGLRCSLPRLAEKLSGGELVFLGRPVNPTGFLVASEELASLAASRPATVFALDEAFLDFVDDGESIIRHGLPNTIVIRSMTKFYALPGLRLGFALAPEHLADKMRRQLPWWTVNTLAQAAGTAVLGDLEYARNTRMEVTRLRRELSSELLKIPGLHVYPSTANYLLVRIDRKDVNGPVLEQRLLERGIAIRRCDNFAGLDDRFFRVAVRTSRENEILCSALADTFGCPVGRRPGPRHTPAIMFQGTSSGAGKSILTAALCRILLQDGYRVAPFKAQNMSLNSCVTRNGEEMGRAQVLQAQACRIEPDSRMNPVLLKPNSGTGSQVIVRGKVVRAMEVAEYIRFKAGMFASVQTAYNSLAAEYDAIVLEGAGSPAEVNLKSHDIVNMRMARHAGAPVLLVGDIDRGGVFASFVGTMEVLAEWERALVAGFIVNRFRGEAALLSDALEYMETHTGRGVLGVIPFLRDLGLPEEDSVAFKSGAYDAAGPATDGIDIALIDLPHISNFTDFDPLRGEPDVRVRIVRTAGELGSPDALIIPGSKNTAGDLEYLRETGLDNLITAIAAEGQTEIIGICAGMQMLGESIRDPHGLETTTAATRGLGLLPVTTELAGEKTLTRARARHVPSGIELTGYEIHHGISVGPEASALVRRADGAVIGFQNPAGRVWGTYLHGLFDCDMFRRYCIDALRTRKGMPPIGRICSPYDLEGALDRLADAVRGSVRIDKIRRIMGLSK